MSHNRCNIWAGMGMGKTSATLFALHVLKTCGFIQKPVLVIAPKRVAASTWPDEIQKWGFDLTISAIVGSEEQRCVALRRHANIYTINYENLPWLKTRLKKWPFGTVVADESTRLKGYRAKGGGVRARVLREYAAKTKHWINLTGTPAPNGLLDLWGQQWFIDGGKALGATYTSYKQRWFDENRYSRKIKLRSGAEKRIQERLKASTLTVDPSDYFDLQKPIHKRLQFELPVKARELYDEMEREFFVEVDGQGVEAVSTGVKFIKCLQMASGFLYTDKEGTVKQLHSEKIELLRSIVEEAAGMPLLVAYHWRPDVAVIKKHFKGARVLDDDPKTIRDWNAGKIQMLLAHPDSAGHGLNLQDGGNILVFYSSWWNYESYAQIVERIGPMRQLQSGHNRPVFIYTLEASDTLDQAVIENREAKGSSLQSLLDATKRRR